MNSNNPFIKTDNLNVKKTRNKHKDTEVYIKVYPNLLLDLIKFNYTTTLVFQHVCRNMLDGVKSYRDTDGDLQYHSIDRIQLNIDKLSNVLDEKSSDVKDAIGNLCFLDILRQDNDSNNHYYINPYKLFIGNRAARYKHHLNIIDNDKDRAKAQHEFNNKFSKDLKDA